MTECAMFLVQETLFPERLHHFYIPSNWSVSCKTWAKTSPALSYVTENLYDSVLAQQPSTEASSFNFTWREKLQMLFPFIFMSFVKLETLQHTLGFMYLTAEKFVGKLSGHRPVPQQLWQATHWWLGVAPFPRHPVRSPKLPQKLYSIQS